MLVYVPTCSKCINMTCHHIVCIAYEWCIELVFAFPVLFSSPIDYGIGVEVKYPDDQYRYPAEQGKRTPPPPLIIF